MINIHTAWEVSKYGIFSGPYFPVFGMNTKIYFVNLRIPSEYKKTRPEKTPYLDTFHAVSKLAFYLFLADFHQIIQNHQKKFSVFISANFQYSSEIWYLNIKRKQ